MLYEGNSDTQGPVVHTSDDPTQATYSTLQAAVAHFNEQLFDGALPPCLITFQRKAGALGYFSAERFENRVDRATTDEIALNPKHIVQRPPEDTLSTLVHEMVHLWQHHFGKPGRGRYHNKEWADRMSELGLEPSGTGKPGGKRTGDRVSQLHRDGWAVRHFRGPPCVIAR
jgi:predicted SprT family Zn-dependent metalloprotease